MLYYIHALGVYFVPGVSNTTHLSQEIDQNDGLFKSIFQLNLEVFSQVRFDQDKTLKIYNPLLLAFGGKDEEHTKLWLNIVLIERLVLTRILLVGKSVVQYHSLDLFCCLIKYNIKLFLKKIVLLMLIKSLKPYSYQIWS